MTNYIDLIIYFISCFVFFHLLEDYLTRISPSKYGAFIVLLITILCSTILCYINMLEVPFLNFISTVCLSMLVANFVYKAKKHWINIFIMILILAISEAISILGYSIFSNVFSINLTKLIDKTQFFTLLTAIFNILIYKIFVYKLYGLKITFSSKFFKLCYFAFVVFTLVNIYLLLIMANLPQIANSPIPLTCWFCITILLFLNLYLLKITEAVSENNDKLIDYETLKLRTNYYHDLNKRQKEMQKVLHDIKNHISTYESYILKSEEKKRAESYRETINSKIDSVFEKTYSLHAILNIILTEKIAIMFTNNIILHYHEGITDLNLLTDYDIVTIFGNLIDNAMNAVLSLPIGSRYINLTVQKINKMFVIVIQNPYSSSSKRVLFNKYSDLINQGHGLPNVKNIVKKYNGEIYITSENNIFEVNIIFHKLQNSSDSINPQNV